MLFGTVVLITALAMAGVAAWFAIAGIMAVFAGAAIPALIMGAVIETGKVVGVSWLYQNNEVKTKIKYFLLPLVLVAMLLTSMGIFGFLSKAHLEQTTPVGNNAAQIERLDSRIARERKKVDDAELVIDQLDDIVRVLIDADRISGPNGSRAVREGQQEQRDALAATIDAAEDNIATYQDEQFELQAQLRELELEVGPVKYIAALVYEDAENNIEDAVRWVIIAFIFVFDPLAIVLLMAANKTLMDARAAKLAAQGPPEDDNPGGDLIDIIDDDPTDIPNVPEIPDDPENPDDPKLDSDSDTPTEASDAAAAEDALVKRLRALNQRRDPTAEELRERSALRTIAERQDLEADIRAGVVNQNDEKLP